MSRCAPTACQGATHCTECCTTAPSAALPCAHAALLLCLQCLLGRSSCTVLLPALIQGDGPPPPQALHLRLCDRCWCKVHLGLSSVTPWWNSWM